MVGPGCLVAFEGIDGAGKTTQIEGLVEWLRADVMPGREIVVLREPGGTAMGEAVRELLLRGDPRGPRAELLLYMAARSELYAQVVLPTLERGALVIIDRSSYSTAAYQGGGLGLDVEAILALGDEVTGGRRPDRVVLLRLDPEQAARRLDGRGTGVDRDRIEARGLDYFRRVAATYDACAAAEPDRFVVVDGSLDPEAVGATVRAGLADLGRRCDESAAPAGE